jgi:mRNA-degrading endonuclease HigB of HigAB toxin-antitoxin module
MIYSTVEGLSFKRFKVCGEYIPSVRMIEGILNDRHTNEAKQQFRDISNEYCELFEIWTWNELPPDFPENKLKRQRIEIERIFLGNKYRLIVSIDYEAQLIYYKYFLTHAEYDKENWKNDDYY